MLMPHLIETPEFQIEPWSSSPQVFYLRNFLSPEECQHLISLGTDQLAPSTTVDPNTGELLPVEGRTSSNAFLELGKTPVVETIEARLAALVNKPVVNGEGIQIIHYQVGQGYTPHFDFFDPLFKGSEKILETGGQRLYTVIMYLNQVEAGGETVFPEIDRKVLPKKGDAIFFHNCLPNGEVDRMSLHGSAPVISGEKWIATKWVREREYI